MYFGVGVRKCHVYESLNQLFHVNHAISEISFHVKYKTEISLSVLWYLCERKNIHCSMVDKVKGDKRSILIGRMTNVHLAHTTKVF